MDGPAPVVSTHGNVRGRAVDYASKKVTALYRIAPRPVIHASVRLGHEPNPAVENPAVAEATLDMKGKRVRAHVAATTMTEAIDRLENRLRRQLHDLAEKSLTRHRQEERSRPPFAPRDPDERDVVRRKTFALDPVSPDEAVDDMLALDHDFYLFTNVDTREENLVARDDGKFDLYQLRAYDLTLPKCAYPIRPVDVVAPELHQPEAFELLEDEAARFVFYLDRDANRGHVAYRRFDGNYGLIQPADEDDGPVT